MIESIDGVNAKREEILPEILDSLGDNYNEKITHNWKSLEKYFMKSEANEIELEALSEILYFMKSVPFVCSKFKLYRKKLRTVDEII